MLTSLGYWKLSCRFAFCTPSVVTNEFVSTSKEACVSTAVGGPVWRASLSPAWPFSEPEVREDQRLTFLLSKAWRRIRFLPLKNVRYWSLLCLKKLNTNPLFKTLITMPRHFDETCACARKRIVRRRCSAKRDIQNLPQKQLQTFPVYFDWSMWSVAKRFC